MSEIYDGKSSQYGKAAYLGCSRTQVPLRNNFFALLINVYFVKMRKPGSQDKHSLTIPITNFAYL